MKPKLCAYVGAYRKISFEVNRNLCRSLGLAEANYADALTNRFRVSYSNNTGYVEMSKFIEYRTLPSTPNTIRSPSTPPIFYPTYPSPNSIIGTIIEHKSEIVTVGNNYLLVLDNRNQAANVLSYTPRSEALQKAEKIFNDQMPSLPVEHKDIPQVFSRSPSNLYNSNNETPLLQNFQKLPEDDGSLLRHLKTKYFNSEEYTSAEFCKHMPK
eukprot:NP_508639.2 Uncharacterized protein CELE_C01C4.2 [Caenorhabditis elegans]